jgi:hypothetical protein
MTTIWLAPCCPDGDDCRWAVWFRFDPEVVALLKRVAADARSYDDDTKLWFIEPDTLDGLVKSLRAQGHTVEFSGNVYTDGGGHARSKGSYQQRQRRREQAAADREERRRQWEQRRQEQQRGYHHTGHTGQHRQTPPGGQTQNWAEVLLTAVGPERADAVFRAVSRIVHPDTENGDAGLMRELIAARDRMAAKATR